MKDFLHLRVRIHRWVVWWMVVGVLCGVVAITNILEHSLTRTQEDTLIAMGILNWLLGGLVCYAFEGIQIEEASHAASQPTSEKEESKKSIPRSDGESHAPSDFLLPGNRKSLLPPRYR